MVNPDDFFDQIEHHFKTQLPFVAYRKPNSGEVKAMLQYDDALHKVIDYKESGFVFTPFNSEEDAILIPLNQSEILICNSSVQNKSEESSINFSEDQFSKGFHIDLVQKAIESIKSDKLKKVVLSRCESVKLSNADPINIFNKLLQTYPTAFVYCWFHPKVGLWLGATPETLLTVQGNHFETMALAGTHLFNGKVNFSWGQKEKDEQQIVTKFVLEVLKEKVNDLVMMPTETIKAGGVLHLLTKIKGKLDLKNFNMEQLIKALHPTPAICGIPRDKAKQFILINENYNREFYTGFLGEINLPLKKMRSTNSRNIENKAYASITKVSNLYVNLRCVQLRNNEALIYVGGGITKDSNPENEWIETTNKTNTIKKVLS